MASRLFRINPLSSRLSMRKKEKCVLCMVFLVFMTICFGALFFVPDLRDNYLSTYVFVWTPPTSSPINKHHQEDVEAPGQIPKPSEAPGMYIAYIHRKEVCSFLILVLLEHLPSFFLIKSSILLDAEKKMPEREVAMIHPAQ